MSVSVPETAQSLPGEGAVRPRVVVLFNRIGLLYLLTLAVMLVGSINYNNNVAFMLTFLLGGIGVVCLLHTYRNVEGVQILSAKAAPVFAGEEAIFEIYVHNSHAMARYALELRVADAPAAATLMFSLPPLTTHTLRMALAAPRRGVLRLPRLRLASHYPLGICTAWRHWQQAVYCIVYPHAVGALPLPVLADPVLSSQSGQLSGDEDFAGLRDYRPGDSLRRVAWKVLARERGLHVKRFAGSGEVRVRLRQRNLVFLKDPEAQLSQLARWVLEADHRGLPYNLELDGEAIDFGVGGSHRDRCLQALALHGRRT